MPMPVMSTLFRCFLLSVAVNFAGLALVFMPSPLSHVGELILQPGEAIPLAYWGGLHDPLQILAGLLLNGLFYIIGVFPHLDAPGEIIWNRPKGAVELEGNGVILAGKVGKRWGKGVIHDK
jgi:hypothetical protein